MPAYVPNVQIVPGHWCLDLFYATPLLPLYWLTAVQTCEQGQACRLVLLFLAQRVCFTSEESKERICQCSTACWHTAHSKPDVLPRASGLAIYALEIGIE
jgi:hypothetical protein